MEMKIGAYSEYDKEINKKINLIAAGRPFDEVLQDFPAYTRRQLVTRFLAYYELFKLIQNIPGWIAEVGVYHGFSFFSLGKFLEIFCMGDKTRKIIGFDSFSGFTELSPEDGPEDKACGRNSGGTNPAEFKKAFLELLEMANADCFAPWAQRMLVIDGDARTTIPKYCQENPGLRLSMIHIDVDIYEPVKVALENLYPRLLPGGVLVLDEFAHKDWPGESMAVERCFKDNGWPLPKLQTFGWVGTPTTYLIKENW